MIGFMGKNIDDDDNDNDDDSSGKFMKYFIFQIWIILIFVSSLLSKKSQGLHYCVISAYVV
jgi:hypothetical protein